MGPPTPVIIDCDPGVDDALALALALASPELAVLAVTSVAGNATIDITSFNAGAILAACGRSDVPFAVGASRALVHAYEHGLAPPHGANGVGGVGLNPAGVAPAPGHAVYLLRDLLTAAAPHSVTIIATAPLTNIALLASLHPNLLHGIRRVVVMGGSAGRGNVTPSAEFNTWTDPESAQRVLTDPDLDICLVGLDVTRQATLTDAHIDTLRTRGPLGGLLADMVAGYRDRNGDGWAIHDAVTVAAVIEPALVQTAPVRIEVDTGIGLTRGQTICEFQTSAEFGAPRAAGRNRYSRAGSVQMAVGLDVDGFRRLMMDRLANPVGQRA